MARHLRAVSGRSWAARGTALALVWLAGLAVGFFAVLSVAARYSCSPRNRAVACTATGTTLGVLLAVAVIAVVTTVTVATHDRPPLRTLPWVIAGLLLLGACYLAAHTLLATA